MGKRGKKKKTRFPSRPYLTIVFVHIIAAFLKGLRASCQAARDCVESPLTVKVSISCSSVIIRQKEEGMGAPGRFLTSLMRGEILGAEKSSFAEFPARSHFNIASRKHWQALLVRNHYAEKEMGYCYMRFLKKIHFDRCLTVHSIKFPPLS